MRRFGVVALVLVAIIAALGVGVEFLVRNQVSSQIVNVLANSEYKAQNPTANLAGGSVLLAATQGRFVDISGTADSVTVPIENQDVRVTGVTYQASQIRLVSTTEAIIGQLDLTGTLGWAALTDVAGLPIAAGGEGRVLVTYSVEVMGLNSLQIGISAVPVLDVDAQEVRLDQSRIEVAGIELNETLSQQIIDRVVKPIPLAPDKARVNSLAVTEDGLVVTLTATDVPVNR